MTDKPKNMLFGLLPAICGIASVLAGFFAYGMVWMIFNQEDSEVCRTHPGFEEDLVVRAQSRALAEWHLGRITWADAIKHHQIEVSGPPRLAKGLPTWNKQSGWAHVDVRRTESAGV